MFDFTPSRRQIGIRQRSLRGHCRLGRATELVFVLATGATLLIGGMAEAAALTAGTEAELAAAIATANGNAEADTITLTGNIALTGTLPVLADANGMNIDLGGFTVSGNDATRIFFVDSGTVTIQNGTLADGLAKGGNGGAGDGLDDGAGGGGMGAGGALYVRGDTAPTVTVIDVTFNDNSAVGGNRGAEGSGDGGGGGGGGLGGNGGSYSSAYGGGGGGGAFANGSNAPGNRNGGAGGGVNGGAGGINLSTAGGAGGEYGGGGGGGDLEPGGAGGYGGGGGGSGDIDNGGNGGYGGGGGGGFYGSTAGFGGGAGGYGTSGFGGGDSSGRFAGGGAGFGGAIFVQDGASITFSGTTGFNGGSVAAGTGGNAMAAGTGLFLQNAGVTFAPGNGETLTISDTIADDTGNGGNSGNVTIAGAGTTVLAGINTYTGATNVSSGATLGVTGAIAGITGVADGGTMFANGATFGDDITIAADGGSGGGVFNMTGNVTVDGSINNSGTVNVAGGVTLEETTGDYNNLTGGVVNFNDAGAKTFDIQTGIINNAGTLNFNAGVTTVNSQGGAIQNSGIIAIAGGAAMDATGDTITNTGTINMVATSTLRTDTLINDTGGVVNAAGTLETDVVNQGSGDFNIVGGLINTSLDFTNTDTATLDVGTGTVSVIGNLINTTTGGTGVTVETSAGLNAYLIRNGLSNGSAASLITNNGALYSDTSITNYAGATLNSDTANSRIATEGTLTNNGTLNIQGRLEGSAVVNSGTGATFNVVGDLNADNSNPINAFNNQSSAVLNVSGGTFWVDELTNSSGGTGSTLGTAGVQILSTGGLNTASVTNQNGGTFFNAGTVLAPTISNNAGASMFNSGTMQGGTGNAGILENSGTLTGNLTNSGTARTTGTITGNAINTGTLELAGTLDGTLDNNGAGTVTTTGDTSGITTLTQNSTGLLTVSGGDTLSAQTINVGSGSAGVAIGAGATLEGLGNSMTNASTMTLGAGGTLRDAGLITNQSGALISFDAGGFIVGDSDGSGDEDILNDGTILVGGGTLGVTLGGAGAFDNANLLMLASGSSMTVTGNFSNSGATNMQNGTSGETVTVNGDYSGSGALAIDVDFRGDTADRFIVNGDITGGSTTVFVTDISSGKVSGNDILIASVSGVAAADAFTLATPLTFGALHYDIEQVGSDFVLGASGGFVAEVVGIEALATSLLMQTGLPSLTQRSGFAMAGEAGEFGQSRGAWFIIDAGASNFAPTASGTSYKGETRETRLRGGVNFEIARSDAGQLVVGVNLSYGSANTDIASETGPATISTDALSAGLSATWYGNSGLYVDGQVQYTAFDATINSGGDESSTDGEGYAGALEIGKRISLADTNWTITPRGQVRYAVVAFDDFTSGGGLDTSLDNAESLQMGLGLSAEHATQGSTQAQGLTLYGSTMVYRELGDDVTTIIAGTPVTSEAEDWTGEVGLGVKHNFGNGLGSLYGEVSYEAGFDDPGNNNGVSIVLGGQISF